MPRVAATSSRRVQDISRQELVIKWHRQIKNKGNNGYVAIYSYFQVNRPRSRGTALLIGVNLT
ncbi:MAG: hypothetical protein V7K27_08545 [Nostoc sp.]|uniref:hypothetical protein n=1 Tax=Nostoc sp. TaxID=1180 RepID=UPI002FF81C31